MNAVLPTPAFQNMNKAWEFEQFVRTAIKLARRKVSKAQKPDPDPSDRYLKIWSVRHNAQQLFNGLATNCGFVCWHGMEVLCRTLGAETCQEIGIRICKQEKFTADEAVNILRSNKLPKRPKDHFLQPN